MENSKVILYQFHIYMKLTVLLYILLTLGILFTLYILYIITKRQESINLYCDVLSDEDYLHHMIDHHQVAIDISKVLQNKTNNPMMHHIIRKIIWTQTYEIELMKEIIKNYPDNLTAIEPINTIYKSTTGDYTKPNTVGLTDTYCDPLFFNPTQHAEHVESMEIDDVMYIKHMIPHHQVAVDMSKKLLQKTKNDFMIYFAYRIIRSQQDEIVLLDNLLHNTYNHNSSLFN